MAEFLLKTQFKPSGDQPQAIRSLCSGLKKGMDFQTLLGVTGSGKTFTMANIIAKHQKPTLVLAPNKTLAAQLYREYKNFFPENSVNYFVSYYDYYQPEAYMPISDTYIEKEAQINEEIDRLRHQATSALVTRNDVIVVSSVSCIYNLGLPENYYEGTLLLRVGDEYKREEIIDNLINKQFTRTKGELDRGHFRVRGDNFEIMPAESTFIYQFQLVDKKLSDLKVIDKSTRRLKEELNEAIIFPAKHFVSYDNDRAISDIKNELSEYLDFLNDRNLLLEAERLERRTRYDMEMIKSLGYCHGIENYSRHLLGNEPGQPPNTLLEYFPDDFLLIIDESHLAVPQVRGMYAGDQARKKTLVEHGWRLPSALDNRPLRFDEFLDRLGPVIFTSATPGDFELEQSKAIVEQVIRPTGLVDPEAEIRPSSTQVDDLIKEIPGQQRVLVNTLTKRMAEDLTDFLQREGNKVRWMHSETKTLERTEILKEFREGKFNILVGVNLLREGLDLPEVTMVAILDADREGFLRNERSLIQLMGRAARNADAKVIIYADKVTGSLKRALDETGRRRKKQVAHNKKHGIIPKTITKKIEDFLTT